MCGVFGYVGQQSDVGETILTALKTLEYRGYDSWGLALATPDRPVGSQGCRSHQWPSSALIRARRRASVTPGGRPTVAWIAANSHPHLDCCRRIAVVHNGIIENHRRSAGAAHGSGATDSHRTLTATLSRTW